MTVLQIHPELQALIPPLSADEQIQLERNLLAEGCRDALVVWQEQQMLLDGHHRYQICEQHRLAYQTRTISLPDLDAAKTWMLLHQLGRRNLTPEQMSYLRGKERQLVGQKHGGDRKTAKSSVQNAHLKTDQMLAEKHKVNQDTIRRDAAFATAIDTVATAVGPDARQAILARDTKVGRQEVQTLSTIAKASPQTAKHVLEAVQAASTPQAAKRVVQEAARQLPKPPPPEAAPDQVAPPLTLLPDDTQPRQGLEEILTPDGKTLFIVHNPTSHAVFNKTNEMVDWAAWTWNPVTGCWHGCEYCYARGIANDTRMAKAYPRQFEPTFHPARLQAPANTPVPTAVARPADRNVFVCSMADLFGKWVPEAWIEAVFERVRLHPEWHFLFLTKFPQRLQEIGVLLGGFPTNAWVGCTVDTQARVATAERAFAQIEASVKWLSCEPLRERLTFTQLARFDWIVLGGQSASHFNGTPEVQPAWEWVEHLWHQARQAHVQIYWKENLTVRPKETPWSSGAALVAEQSSSR